LNDERTKGIWHQAAFSSVEQFRDLFGHMPRPAYMDPWPGDDAFLRQRVAGVNPVVLRRVDSLPANLSVSDARLAGVLPAGLTLAALARGGRLFLCDYAMVEGITLGVTPAGPKYVGAPLALFFVDDAGALRSLCIQLGQSPDDPVVTPRDPAWLLAKTYMQVADINHHELGTHLCRTHFVLEGFAVAAARTLSSRHPVAVLLRPHFRILLWNNFEGKMILLSASGLATQLLAGGAQGSVQLVQRSYAGYDAPPVAGLERPRVPGWTYASWDIPGELHSRGVADTSLLPDYPYRDDALSVWEAVGRFVRAYLSVYYASDEVVQADTELAAWAAELSDPQAGRVPDLPPLRGVEDLAALLTRVIFTCGPQHAAVNFPQYDAAAFVPNMPGAAYAPPPAGLLQLSADQLSAALMKALPGPAQAHLQVDTVTELTSYQFDKLGHYEPDDFTDPGALRAVAAFQADLAQVQSTIEARNARRSVPYLWLLPERIPNSTSI
jgi:arachidonate 15-lipoxygenase